MSWIVPDQASDSPVSCRIQSQTTSSTSVRAGQLSQEMPSPPRPDEARSPSTEAREALDGNQPKCIGCWTCVMPGTTSRSRSASSASMVTTSAGGDGSKPDATSPGPVTARTGPSARPAR